MAGFCRLSEPQQHPRRVFQSLLDRNKELNGVLAVDDAMVIGQGDIHHRPNHDLPVLGKLFQSISKSKNETEVVIFLKAKIVK